jgi:predicted small secreted protein
MPLLSLHQELQRREAMFKRIMGLVLFASFLGLTACNTMEGAGRDVESAGETIQDKADRNRPSDQ